MTASLHQVSNFKNRTLVVLCGTSPAVLTETLEVISDPKHRLYFPPTRIIVITTRVGREKLKEELLDPTVNSKLGLGGIGRLQRMAEDIGLAPFPLAETDILVPSVASADQDLDLDSGESLGLGLATMEIEDAHSEAELQAIGDLIFETVRTSTTDALSALMLSISGGRKSMAHIAGQCMSAYGRAWDKLVHVIVYPQGVERESASPRFYYRVPNDVGDISWTDEDGVFQPVKASDVSLQLNEEPYFRLQPILQAVCVERRIDMQGLNFAGLISLLDRDPAPVLNLEIRKRSCSFSIEGRTSKTHGSYPAVCAYLLLLAESEGPIRSIPNDRQMLRFLQIWDEISQAFDDDKRYERLCVLFNKTTGPETAGPARPQIRSFSPENVAAHFQVNLDDDKWSERPPRGDTWMNLVTTAAKKCIKSAVPFGVSVSHYNINPSRGWWAIPKTLQVTVQNHR